MITFNTWAASQAATDFLLMLTGLIDPGAPAGYIRFPSRLRSAQPVTPITGKTGCADCGTTPASRRARGQGAELPLPERHPRRGHMSAA